MHDVVWKRLVLQSASHALPLSQAALGSGLQDPHLLLKRKVFRFNISS